jgi:hypothetical protein
MLELNPNDNQGIRYLLLGCLLRRDDAAAVKELLAAYKDEWSACWLYTRALVAFREGHASEQQAARLVQDAWSANQHLPAILAGTKPPVTPSAATSRWAELMKRPTTSGIVDQLGTRCRVQSRG